MTLIRAVTYADEALRKRALATAGITDGGNITWPLPNLHKITGLQFEDYRSGATPWADVYIGTIKIGDEWAIARALMIDDIRIPGGGLATLYFYSGSNKRVEYFTWQKCMHAHVTGHDTIRGDHSRVCADCGLKWGWDSSD